jgi:hypothetical protein
MTKTHNQKGTSKKEAKGFDSAQVFRLIFGAGGIYFIYILYGLIQERM